MGINQEHFESPRVWTAPGAEFQSDYCLDPTEVIKALSLLGMPRDKNISVMGTLSGSGAAKTTVDSRRQNPGIPFDIEYGTVRYQLPILPRRGMDGEDGTLAGDKERMEMANLDGVDFLLRAVEDQTGRFDAGLAERDQRDCARSRRAMGATVTTLGAWAIISYLTMRGAISIDAPRPHDAVPEAMGIFASMYAGKLSLNSLKQRFKAYDEEEREIINRQEKERKERVYKVAREVRLLSPNLNALTDFGSLNDR